MTTGERIKCKYLKAENTKGSGALFRLLQGEGGQEGRQGGLGEKY